MQYVLVVRIMAIFAVKGMCLIAPPGPQYGWCFNVHLHACKMKVVDVEALGLTLEEDIKQATMINGIIAGERPNRPKQIEKVASGQAKFEPVPRLRAPVRHCVRLAGAVGTAVLTQNKIDG